MEKAMQIQTSFIAALGLDTSTLVLLVMSLIVIIQIYYIFKYSK